MSSYNAHRIINRLDSAVPSEWKRWLRSKLPDSFGQYYRLLSRFTKDQNSRVVIQSGPLAGRHFNCNLKYERPYFVGNYEPAVASAIQAHVADGMTVYDIGVHRGYFALIFAIAVGARGRVVGFEPSPNTIAAARDNISLNSDLREHILLYQLAVSNRTGHETLLTSGGISSMARIRYSEVVESAASYIPLDVESISLDDFVASGNPPPAFIKMDIEGAEEFAFDGAMDVLMHNRPKIIVEIHHPRAWNAIKSMMHRTCYSASTLGDSINNDAVSAEAIRNPKYPFATLLLPNETRN
jgi:FkbM family methyltransferase